MIFQDATQLKQKIIMKTIKIEAKIELWTITLIHTVDTKTLTPALRQTVTAISTTNTWCAIYKWDSLNIKIHVAYMILALVLAIISLLDEQRNTFTFSASRSGGDSFLCPLCVVSCNFDHKLIGGWMNEN